VLRQFSSATAAVAVASLALVASGIAQAASAPTSVSLLTGTNGGAKFAGLVALQKVGAGRVRLAGIVTGLPAGKADLAVVNAADCAQPIGHERLRVQIRPGTAFDVRGKLTGPLGTGQALALLFADYKQFVCTRLPAFGKGAAGVVRSSSGARVGVVTSQRRPSAIGLVLLARSKPSAVTATASRSSCSGPAAAAATLKLSRSNSFFFGDVLNTDFATYGSLAPLRRHRLREVGALRARRLTAWPLAGTAGSRSPPSHRTVTAA
jgi:hypothetical protein